MKITIKSLRSKIALFLSALLIIQFVMLNGNNVHATLNTGISYTVKGNTIVGNTIDIAFNVSNVNDLYGGSIDFIYDPTLLQVQGITKGDIFGPQNILTPLGGVGKVDSNKGEASFALTLSGNEPGVPNSGTLAIIKAKVLRSGSLNLNTTNSNSALNLSNSTVRIKLSNSKATHINYSYKNTSINLSEENNLIINSINTYKVSPQAVNSTIRISPAANGNGTLTYKFWIHDGSSWSIPQDFSTKSYFDWTPTKPGTYRLWVDVKDSSGKMVSKEIKYVIK